MYIKLESNSKFAGAESISSLQQVLLMAILMAATASSVLAIHCYTCSSRNRTMNACHDPFHPYNASYVKDCKVPKEGHIGLFPAQFCVKVIGITEKTGEELVVRACSMENMENQCGGFRFQDEVLTGCILTCGRNGCNWANDLQANGLLTYGLAISILFVAM